MAWDCTIFYAGWALADWRRIDDAAMERSFLGVVP